ncbi:MAG: DUF835 domain-containing protein, partial [Candidatus Altiarchaeota archaeon]|nr:DUF835 domain-containing protein [Candidatus Altiarchaeota archaeon]
AAEILGVKRETIKKWMEELIDKRLVDVESTSISNPTIKPDNRVLEKFRRHIGKKFTQDIDVTNLELEEKQFTDDIQSEGTADKEEIEDEINEINYAGDGLLEDEKIEKEAKNIPSNLDPGTSYLILEKKPKTSIRFFEKETKNGYMGLYIARDNPKRIMEKMNAENPRFVWLTNVTTKQGIECVSGLQDISILISQFIDENEKTVVLLDGMEYLISNNEFSPVLRLIQQIRDKVAVKDSKFLMPLDPQSIEEREKHLLERECVKIDAT